MNFQAPAPESKFYYKKIFASSRHRWAGMTEDWKRERIFIYWKCAQDQIVDLLPQIFLEHPKKAWLYEIPARVPCKAQPSASIQWPVLAGPCSRVGITRFRGNKWETLLNNGDKDHLGHLSVALPWMCVHCRARNECSRSLYGEGSFWGLAWVSPLIRSLHLCPNF